MKEALQAVGLKAGGTARQRAERLMLLRDTPLHKLDRKHFAKGIIPAVSVCAACDNCRAVSLLGRSEADD